MVTVAFPACDMPGIQAFGAPERLSELAEVEGGDRSVETDRVEIENIFELDTVPRRSGGEKNRIAKLK